MAGTVALHGQIDTLIADIARDADARLRGWATVFERPDFEASARNLAHYLALRQHDLRPLQGPLMALGLSSLGRAESRVMPALLALRRALAALADLPAEDGPTVEQFFAGEGRLAARATAMLGGCKASRPIALMVTCPSEAAEDPAFMHALAERRIEAIRINCAHDDADHWQLMIDHARAAERATGHAMKIFMDLAGPKMRTGRVRMPEGTRRVHRDDLLALVPVGGLDKVPPAPPCTGVECSLPEALATASPGDRLFLDDGKIAAVVEEVCEWGLRARVTKSTEKGVKLKPEKGLNFPDGELDTPALTAQDRKDLAFVAKHAHGINYSFVQTAADVEALQAALAVHRPDDWHNLSLILKIETPRAVRNLPEIIVKAAARQPAGIMIARGDLSVEIGFARTAEMQEEILWLGEAAQVPVIWATQVLEHFIKEGTPSRGEMTDAAMAARAECVMLNKGPFLLDAIGELDTLLARMDEHQHKKTARLRRLASWSPLPG